MKCMQSLASVLLRRELSRTATAGHERWMVVSFSTSVIAGGRNVDPALDPGSRELIAEVGAKRSRRVWTPEEDDVLRNLVSSVKGKVDWRQIASSLTGRKPSQCKWRWEYSLNPTIKLGDFTEEEDRMLAELVEKHGAKWTRISSCMNGRTRIQCRQRWDNLQALTMPTKGPWSMDEIATFLRMQSDLGNKFVKIAKHLNRPLYDVHKQYRRLTMESPTRHSRFTREEVLALKEAVEELGHRSWQAVAARLPGRNALQCKSKWQYLQRLEQPAGGWSAAEDRLLVERVQRYGDSQWTLVAEALNRSGAECRARWKNCLHRRLNEDTPWAAEEDAILLRLHHAGRTSDAMMSSLPRRTLQSIRHRLAELCPKEDLRDWTHEETTVLLQTLASHPQRPIDWALVAQQCGFSVSPRQCAVRYRCWRNTLRAKHSHLADRLSNLQPTALQSLLEGVVGEAGGKKEGEDEDDKRDPPGDGDGENGRRKGRTSRRSIRRARSLQEGDEDGRESAKAILHS